MTKIETFNGDFEYLPLLSDLTHSPVPMDPSSTDFHMAVSDFEHEQSPVSLWRLEAIRWRLANRNKSLDLQAIKQAVSKRIYEAVV